MGETFGNKESSKDASHEDTFNRIRWGGLCLRLEEESVVVLGGQR